LFFFLFRLLTRGGLAAIAADPAEIQSLWEQLAETQGLKEQLAEAQSKFFTFSLYFLRQSLPVDWCCCTELAAEVGTLKETLKASVPQAELAAKLSEREAQHDQATRDLWI
jgi:hypothetical protein